MKTLKIVLEDEAPIKKKARKSSWTYTDNKTGAILPRQSPISWYSKAWRKYGVLAIQRLYAWKQVVEKTEDIKFPLRGEYVISIVFFRKTVLTATIDLENLEGGILDILAGNSGIDLSAKHWKIDHSDYKILNDDSIIHVKNHGASACFYSPSNPHTEIFISDFDLVTYAKVFQLWHPQAKLGWIPTQQTNLFQNSTLLDDL